MRSASSASLSGRKAWVGQQAPHASESLQVSQGLLLEPEETLASILQLYDEVAAETERVIAAIPDLGQAVPVPKDVPWFPSDVDAWSVRWVLLHLSEETARHAGHADIVRESLDGATAFPLLAAVEGWPPHSLAPALGGRA